MIGHSHHLPHPVYLQKSQESLFILTFTLGNNSLFFPMIIFFSIHVVHYILWCYDVTLLLKAMLIYDRVGYILMGKNQQEHREFALLISYCFLMNTLQS